METTKMHRSSALCPPAVHLPSKWSTLGLESCVFLAPLAIVGLYSILLAVGRTRPLALACLQENGPVELVTFALLLAGSVMGLRMARDCRRQREPLAIAAFYSAFAFGLLLTAMEEVAWGQWFFGFATPKLVLAANRQGELTLHNLQGVHEHLAQLNAVFGIGGLVGVVLVAFRPFHKIGAPRILVLWFLVEALLATADEWVHAYPLHNRLDKSIRRLAELNELLIAMSAILYLLYNRRRLATRPATPRPTPAAVHAAAVCSALIGQDRGNHGLADDPPSGERAVRHHPGTSLAGAEAHRAARQSQCLSTSR